MKRFLKAVLIAFALVLLLAAVAVSSFPRYVETFFTIRSVMRRKKDPHYRHKDAAHRAEGYVRVNGSLHGFEIFCPEIAADDDARAQ